MNLVQLTEQARNSEPNSFWSQLQPASFRGVPFGVFGGQAKFGRRNALHEYPFRDTPWVEDLGRQSRRIQLTGFIVGDDVIKQREALVAACEKPGDGDLIHPTFGRLNVALIDVETSERWETGRVFEVSFTFLEQGERLFPGSAVSSDSAINSSATAVTAAATAKWSSSITSLIKANVPIAPQVFGVTQSWASSGLSAVNSATGLMNLATAAVGNYGRMLGQASGIAIGLEQAAVQPLENMFGAAAALRTSVASIKGQIEHAGATLTAGTLGVFAGLAASYASAVRGACFTPADAMRSLIAMASPGGPTIASSGGSACADLFRRIAVSQLAIAAGQYQPSTSDEAVFVRAQTLLQLDAEILLAGNQGDDGVYVALKALRAQSILDMNAKGAQLPTLITVTTPSSIPALTLAQRLYRDSGREAELVRRAGPIHPAFMPIAFVALNT